MAAHRMIAKAVVGSARFIKMPPSSQNLYFHLCVNADDDGIVEGFTVLNMIKANEDDLRVLVGKGFVRLLNEELVAYIPDWLKHNKLRPDRKRDSIYKELLLQIDPTVKLLEPKSRSDRPQSKVLKKDGTDMGRSQDGPWTAEDSTREDRLVKVSRGQCIIQSAGDDRETDNNDYKSIIAENVKIDWLRNMAEKCGGKEVDMINEIFDLICDCVCYPQSRYMIDGTYKSGEAVKEQYLKLKPQHIKNVLNRVLNPEFNIKNMRSYLVSSLYNETLSGTIESQAELNDEYLYWLRGNPYEV